MSKQFNFEQYIDDHTLRCEVSHRGGGIEIDASEYTGIEGARMTAYQNYLGGGMTGAIQSDHNFHAGDANSKAKADELAEALKRYFYNLSNPIVEDYDEWAAAGSYEQQQNRPGSGL